MSIPETFVTQGPSSDKEAPSQAAPFSPPPDPGMSTKDLARLLAELEEKNRELNRINREMAMANAEAAELIAEIELRNQRIEQLNEALSQANAHAVEVLAEVDEKNRLLNETNRKLAAANATAAELMAEMELKNEQIEKLNQRLVEQNREIALLSITDPLTGSYNRNHLNAQLPAEIQRSLRSGHALSLILCDIDHFKKINDTYGHRAGDLVLRGFGECLRGSVRADTDWVVRFGGEEFLIVLPETGHEAAVGVAERLRCRISEMEIDPGDGSAPIRITASFGVATLAGGRDRAGKRRLTMESLIEEADQRLYLAKSQGRNRVVGDSDPGSERPASQPLDEDDRLASPELRASTEHVVEAA